MADFVDPSPVRGTTDRPLRVCVYCGSNDGRSPAYRAAAETLGHALVEAGVELVFGGGRVGLMGAVADAVIAAGGRATGVIPGHLVAAEVAHAGLHELRVVDSMHERKATMIALADGFVALPGGLGTLEELFEVLTWNQLGLVDKPVVVLDVDGFYGPLVEQLGRSVEAGFVHREHVRLVRHVSDPVLAVTEALREPDVGYVPKWLEPHDGSTPPRR